MKNIAKTLQKHCKNISFLAIGLVVLCALLHSCIREDSAPVKKSVTIESSLSAAEFNRIINGIADNVRKGVIARNDPSQPETKNPVGEENTDAEYQAEFQSLIFDGMYLQQEFLMNRVALELDAEDIQVLNSLDNVGFATLSFVYNSLTEEESAAVSTNPGQNKALDCLSFAVGYSAASGVFGYITGTAALTSKATIKIVTGLIGRSVFGWGSVAYAVYEFTSCMRQDNHEVELPIDETPLP